MLAVGRPFEPPLLPAAQAVLAHQPRRATSPDGEAIILQLARHARTTIGAVRQCERRADMRQHHHVVTLAPAGRAILPGKIAALADVEHAARRWTGKSCFARSMSWNLIDLPPGRKAVARFNMSRS
jgi:hypothetical protein